MRVGERDPRRQEGEAISTGRMTAADAIGILRGPRRVEIQELLDEFFTAWGYVLAHHPRVMQFGAFVLWLEQRRVCLSRAPEKKVGVAGRENEDREEEDADHA